MTDDTVTETIRADALNTGRVVYVPLTEETHAQAHLTLARWIAYARSMTTTQNFAEYRDDNEITETDAQGRYARIERDVESGGMPKYVVLLGTNFGGTILDEADADGNHLPRGRYAAWSAKTGTTVFTDTIEEAADLIAATWPRPTGPKGTELPRQQARAWTVGDANPMRKHEIISHAARLHAEGGRTVAKAWKDAVDADWQRQIAAVELPDEDTIENCISVLGGMVHTAQWGNPEYMRTLPLCRTGAQDHMRTRYTITKLELTCVNCIEQKQRRKMRRAAQQG